MKGRLWLKTILQSYNIVNMVNKAIDNRVNEQSIMSHLHTYGYDDTLELTETIINLIERKKNLLLIKSLVDDCLNFIDPEFSKLLVLFFIDRYSQVDIAKIFNLSRRTLQRRINKGLDMAVDFFIKNGYSYNVLEKMFAKESWLIGMYNDNVSKLSSKYHNLKIETNIQKIKFKNPILQSVYFDK